MISVIIPCKNKADLCPELLPALKNTHVIIVDDKTCPGSPAEKRDWATSRAKGRILAFIDSDAYPAKNWLLQAEKCLRPTAIAAVCGPGLTPKTDTPLQQISGLVWSTKIGAGPYTYRSRQEKPRFVDDYPSFNLIIKKPVFIKLGGFNNHYWPGEDTKLCHDLVYKLNAKILYHPEILVYHHRRPVFSQHLQQISRYGWQRGRFVKIFPKTSRRFSYFLPLFLPLIFPVYLIAVILTAAYYRLPLLAPAILLTHLTYAFYFGKGVLFSSR